MCKKIKNINKEYRCVLTKESGHTFKKLLRSGTLEECIAEAIKRFQQRQEEKHYTDIYVEELEINKYYLVEYEDGSKSRHNACSDTVYKKSFIKDLEIFPLLGKDKYEEVNLSQFGLIETLESEQEKRLFQRLLTENSIFWS